jgi:hypothetical protein
MKDFVTEAEAGTKMCPIQNDSPDERLVPICVGSECMAWRWSNQDAGPNDPPTGFCGLAGIPQLRGR